MLERHIANILLSHLSNIHSISDNQWGFTPKTSTTTALLSVIHVCHQHREHGTEVYGRYLLIFVRHLIYRPLIHKLEELGLAERKQHAGGIVSGETSSALSAVASGVLQGSVLGPLLFIIYVDGVESVTLPDDTVVMFADDMHGLI